MGAMSPVGLGTRASVSDFWLASRQLAASRAGLNVTAYHSTQKAGPTSPVFYWCGCKSVGLQGNKLAGVNEFGARRMSLFAGGE